MLSNQKDYYKDGKLNIIAIETAVLDFWKENLIRKKYFHKSNKSTPEFLFYEGPPFATGKPHYGHALSGFIKDAIIRHRCMRGFSVNLCGGWDCHGVPVEYEVQKEHNLLNSLDIQDMGVKNFNDLCRGIVLKCVDDWDFAMKRIARWVDHENPYMTMDKHYMEGIWTVFHALYQKGLVYQGEKVLPYSSALETPISNFEAADNYKLVNTSTVYFLADIDLWNDDTKLLVWTTLPWTCVVNMALGVSSQMQYVRIFAKRGKKKIVLSRFALESIFKSEEEFSVLEEFTGERLIGLKYRPILNLCVSKCVYAYQILGVDFIEKTGTGIVSLAPSFGEDDFQACRQAGITGFLNPIDSCCRFTAEVSKYCGMNVHNSSEFVISDLRDSGKLFMKQSISHKFPFCPRTDTPIVYRSVHTWFLNVVKIKSNLILNNKQIRWNPSFIGSGRFGNWLAQAKDWAISRNRFWGTPIPVWKSDSGKIKVVKSIEELQHLSAEKNIGGLHREVVDKIEFEIQGEIYKRCTEVFDCWFESGSVSICQNASKVNIKHLLEQAAIPADFISEGIDQTRGWFYTLMVISTALFNKPAFKNVIVNGTVLAEDGSKMSKRLKNYPELLEVVETVGADPLRLYLLKSPATKAEDVRFSEQGCAEMTKSLLVPLWQAYKGFLKTYIDMFEYKPTGVIPLGIDETDKWVLFEVADTVQKVNTCMNNYNIQSSVLLCELFLNNLNNWYIRLSRRKFWDDEIAWKKIEVLRFVLIEFSKILAPFAPLFAEFVYQGLKLNHDAESVHLATNSLENIEEYYEKHLEIGEDFRAVKGIITLGRSSRKSSGINLRQPLASVKIISSDGQHNKVCTKYELLIKQELNVDNIVMFDSMQSVAIAKILPKYEVLGPLLGKEMGNLLQAIKEKEQDIIDAYLRKESIMVKLSSVSIKLDNSNIDLRYILKEKKHLISQSNGIFLMYDLEITPALHSRGIAREFVHHISNIRKSLNFDLNASINVAVYTVSTVLKESIVRNLREILDVTQCLNISFSEKVLENCYAFTINGHDVVVDVNVGV